MKKVELNKNTSLSAVTSAPKHHFFGYYDLCPWNESGDKILGMEVDFLDRSPRENDEVKIGVVNLKKEEFNPVAKTEAWNWQQGCRLQWLPGSTDKIIYNDRRKERFVSVVRDIRTGRKRIIPFPIYDLRPSGKYAVSLNFSRLSEIGKGYGYKGGAYDYLGELIPEEDGIYLVNLEDESYRLIVSLKQLSKFHPIDLMKEGKHWVNHLMFNPQGNRFAFLHRFQLETGGTYTRLLTAKKDGSELKLLLDTGKISHFDWKNNDEILAWARLSSRVTDLRKKKGIKTIRKLLMPIYYRFFNKSNFLKKRIIKDYYLLIDNKTGENNKIGEKVLIEDGHCSVSPDGNWILTDTYPDQDHYRNLILYNFERRKRMDIGKFYSLPDKRFGVGNDWDYSAMRCDLHPRWNRDGTQICFDSVHEGTRQIYIASMSNIMIDYYYEM